MSDAARSRLRKPIVIPAVRSSPEANFVRAYPSVLSAYGISQSQFVNILDRLNEVRIGVPLLRVLSEAPTVSPGVETAAEIGHHATGQTQAEFLIHKVNKEVLKPKGLKMEIVKLSAVAKLAGMNRLLNEKGKLRQGARILESIQDLVREGDLTAQQRRLAALEPWIEHLEMVPAAKKTVNRMKRLESSAMTFMQRHYETEMKRSRIGGVTLEYQREISKIQQRLDRELAGLQDRGSEARRDCVSNPVKPDHKLHDIQRHRFEAFEEFNDDIEDADGVRKHDDKEGDEIENLLFLTIRNLDADSGFGTNAFFV